MSAPTPTAARVHGGSDAHWYQKDGSPCYEVPRATGGGMRKTTLADARKMGLLPSVTTIISEVLAKPALMAWIVEQACLAVLTAPRKEGEQTDAFVKRVLHVEQQQNEERDEAARLGHAVHNALEDCLRLGMDGTRHPLAAYIAPVLALPMMRGRVMATERTVTGDGYAGKYDAEMDTEPAFLEMIDFKTTKSVPDPAKGGSWDEHVLQLSAYARARARRGGLGDKRIRCWNVYVSTRQPGLVVPIENTGWEEAYEDGFAPLVRHWQWKKGYRP